MYPTLLTSVSDNALGADNQQERLGVRDRTSARSIGGAMQLGDENPQRLYADLVGEHDEMR